VSRVLIGVVMAMITTSLMVLMPPPASAQIINAQCYALPDNASDLYVLQLDTSNPGPASIIDLDRTYTGEASAFSPVTQTIVAWTGNSDREMWTIDPITGEENLVTANFHAQFNDLDQTQGAAVAYDRITQTEILYVLVDDDNDFMVYELDIATGVATNPIGPITGDFDRPASLAIDPFDGTWYVTRDSGTRRLGILDPATAVITTIANITGNPDAEGLDFADDGQIYTEEDRGSLGGRHIYQVDRLTGDLQVATQSIPGTGDIEGVTCNANTSVVLDPCSAVGQGNGGVGSGNITDVTANNGDETINQVVLTQGGFTYVYNSSSGFIRDSSNQAAALDSVRINVGGSNITLDEFNFSSADVQFIGYPAGITGVHTSENGVQNNADTPGFEGALERVFDSADLRDYLDHGVLVPAASSFSPDYSVMFDNPLDNDDFIIAIDRDGDDEFILEALDVNGDVISNSDAVRVQPNYRWNTGYAPSDQTDEGMWLTVFDVEKFNTTTSLTPIYGFRVDNDGGAELKIIGASDDVFVAPPAGGGPVAIQSGAWTGAGSTWTAPFGTGTVTAVATAPAGTITEIGPATMDPSTYSEATVSGADAFVVTHAHGTNATLSFTFSQPLVDPVLHLGRIGGFSGDPSQSHSSYLELAGGVTWSELAANDVHFMSTPNAVWRQAGTILDWRKTGDIGGPTWGTVAGSMQVNGTVSSVTLTITNAVPMGVEDLIEFVWTGIEQLPPLPPASGCGEITASKTASASTVAVGDTLEWSLDADSTGSVDIRNSIMFDVLAPELSATQLYTGTWTPVSEQALIEIDIDGTWQSVGTFDGDDAGTYALPPGVDAIRATFTTDLDKNFTLVNPISLTTEVIRPDRDGVAYSVPANVQNCFTWDGDNMAAEVQCTSITIPNTTARPDVTVWSESTGLVPGDVASFRIRVENDWAATSELIDPFLTDLLPAEFIYSSWAPITTGFTPTLTTFADHDGTGSELLKWDFTGYQMAPGAIYDLRVFAIVAPGTPAGDYLNTVLGGTNDTTYSVECAGTTAIDTNDQDLDGDRLEQLCDATTAAGTTVVPSVVSVSGSAYAEAGSGLPNVDVGGGAGGGPLVNGPNLAPAGAATQLNTDFGGDASRAIDGNTDGDWAANSVTHTEFATQPYWEVDLGSVADLNEIAIWNRTDCCSDRLSDVWVFASDTPFASTDPNVLDGDSDVWSTFLAGDLQPETRVAVENQPTAGTIKSTQKISDTAGGLTTALGGNDRFGRSVTGVGDIDGDGVDDVVVGAYQDDDGGGNRGAIFVLFMNSDGTVKAEQKISHTSGGLGSGLGNGDRFGYSVASLGDLDGDGVGDVAVGARQDDDGGSNRGAVYVLFLNSNGTVKSKQKISHTSGGLGSGLGNNDRFGNSVASLGDLDGDGVVDIAVGAHQDDDGGGNRGAVYVLFLNSNGTVKSKQKISHTSGGLGSGLGNGDWFGSSVAGIGDLDGDGTRDLLVGAERDDDGTSNTGAVYVLFMNSDGTVGSKQKISDTSGSLSASLGDNDRFGASVASIGDIDGDGTTDLAIGAYNDDDGGSNRGAVYVLFMNADGTVGSEQKLSANEGGLAAGSLGNSDNFGISLSRIGDLDGDGVEDLAVGAHGDDDGSSNRGAVYVLNLDMTPGGGTVTGRYVRVQLDSSNYLSLAEVEVFEAVVAGSCPAGGFAQYSCAAQALSNTSAGLEYEVANSGNVAMDDFVMVAMLPQLGDVGLTTPAPQVGEWRGALEGPINVVQVPAGGVVDVLYSQSLNPCRPELNGLAPGTIWPTGCTDDWAGIPADLDSVTAIRATVSFASPVKWVGGETLRLRADIQVGQGSPNTDQLGVSSFAYTMNLAATGQSIGVTETDPAVIVVPQALNGIGNFVWEDENGDGIQDAGEVGRNGVVVQLYSVGAGLVETVTTQFLDGNSASPGHYWFGDLAPGDYYIQFELPPNGLNTVPADQGGDDAVDSDADPANMRTPNVTVGTTDINLTVDTGYFVPAGPIECVSPTGEFDPTAVDQERRQVNDPRPCPG